MDDGERLEAEHVHLEHADLLQRAHLVLRDDGVLAVGRRAGALGRRGAHRHVLRQRARRDHHARGVHRHVPRDALDPRAQVHQPLVRRIGLHQVAQLVHLLPRLVHRERVGGARRDELGHPVGLAGRNPEHPRDVLHRGAGLHRPEGDDLAHAAAAVSLADVLDHLAPALEAEVHVDVGHGHPLGIEEPLEQEVELEGADVGDPEGVGHDRARRRAAAGAHRDPAIPRRGDEVLHDQEVAGVARAVDDAELVRQPLRHLRWERRPVAALRALAREVLQQRLVAGVAGRAGEAGQEVLLLEVELAEVRHPRGVGERVRLAREQRPHFLLRLHVRFLSREAEPLGIVEVAPGTDREQHVVRLRVLPPEIVRVVGGDHADAQLLAQAEHPFRDQTLLGDPVLLDLQPEAVGAEGAREPLGAFLRLLVLPLAEVQRHLAREARGQAHDALGMLGEHLLVDPRTAVETLGEPDRGEPHQVPVPRAIAGEEHQVAVGGRRPGGLLPRLPRPEREVGLEAEDRPDPLDLGLLVEAPGGVHVAVVGDRQAVHAQPLDVGHQLGNPVGPVEERILAVGVEMDERHGGLAAHRLLDSSSRRTASSGTPRAFSKTSR